MCDNLDFFKNDVLTGPINYLQFGLIDDSDTFTKVHIDSSENWIATIENKLNLSVYLTPIDKALIKANDLQGYERCDAMLFTDCSLFLVELKNRKGNSNDWWKKGINQLKSTIKLLKLFHNESVLQKYKLKSAYLCNKRRPNFSHSVKDIYTEFYKENGFLLQIKTSIEIEK